jgi:hypothetical protein
MITLNVKSAITAWSAFAARHDGRSAVRRLRSQRRSTLLSVTAAPLATRSGRLGLRW